MFVALDKVLTCVLESNTQAMTVVQQKMEWSKKHISMLIDLYQSLVNNQNGSYT